MVANGNCINSYGFSEFVDADLRLPMEGVKDAILRASNAFHANSILVPLYIVNILEKYHKY